MDADSALRETLPGYRDVVPLARGRHSSVYRAVESPTGRSVALKVLDVAGVSARELEAFAREIAVLGRLSAHPNIVTLYGSARTTDGRPVLALELCRESLAERLRRGAPLTPGEAMALAVKMAGALETAHRAGVLHRDVRPANVLLSEFGEPLVADFGVARLHSAVPAGGELFDFPSEYVAPELLLGLPASEASDVYGLAATLYHLLAGGPPLPAFAGERPAATILRILRDTARPVPRADLPVGLNDLLLWALAKEPEQRPPGMAWFAEELMRVESRGRSRHTEAVIGESAVSVGEPVPLPAPAGAHRARQRPLPHPRASRPDPERSDPERSSPDSRGNSRTASRERATVFAPWAAVLPGQASVAAPLWAAAAVLLVLFSPPWPVLVAVLAVLAALTAALSWLARPALVVTPCHLEQRGLVRRELLPWAAVTALQAAYDPARRPGGPHGVLIALDADGPVPLAATRRPAADLTALAAGLEAYRDPARSCPHRS